MKVANIIGKVMMVVFGIASLNWFATMLGLFGRHFWVEDLSDVGICVLCFVVGCVITASTNKKAKKK